METEKNSRMIEIFIAIKDGPNLYYLLKVVKRESDVYCIPPNLGVHFSLHESGESHFRYENKSAETGEEPPLALIMGEAGTPVANGIIRSSLSDQGRASGICTALFSIVSLTQDFREFNRSPRECFVIDSRKFPIGTSGVEIGIWAVPARNQISFEFNNRGINADLLYKVSICEPQIWIYARPL